MSCCLKVLSLSMFGSKFGAAMVRVLQVCVCQLQQKPAALYLQSIHLLSLPACALQMKLPGGGCVRARVGLHRDEASDGLVGSSTSLHYRSAARSADTHMAGTLMRACAYHQHC